MVVVKKFQASLNTSTQLAICIPCLKKIGINQEYSQELDNLTNNYGAMPTSEQIREMPKFKAISHQRRENDGTQKSNQYQVNNTHGQMIFFIWVFRFKN